MSPFNASIGKTATTELRGEIGAARLRANENDARLNRFGFKDTSQCVEFVESLHQPIGLSNIGKREFLAGHGDPRRVVGVAIGNQFDLSRHRRREERKLSAVGRVAQDPFDVIDESHAEHFVCFVENQQVEFAEFDRATAHQVHDAPGRPDNDLRTGFYFFDLRHDGLAAIHGCDSNSAELCRVGLDGLRDLQCEFTRRRQNQRLDGTFIGIDAMKHRQSKRCSLACAGLRLADEVAAFD